MKPDALHIGEVAKLAGVNIQTLRYYERRGGLLPKPKRSASGYRIYPPETVALIRFIKRAQDLGFTLEEAEDLLRLQQVKGMRREKARSLAAEKIKSIDEKLSRLAAMRSAIGSLLDACACSEGGLTCPILEALSDQERSSTAPLSKGNKKMKTVSLSVEGMRCQSCVARVKTALTELAGVGDIDVDLGGKRVSVRLTNDGTTSTQLAETIRNLGYEVAGDNVH